MQKQKESWDKPVNPILFQNTYSILQLAANAGFIKTSSLLKLIRWARDVLIILREFSANNCATFFEFFLIDPMDFFQEVFYQL